MDDTQFQPVQEIQQPQLQPNKRLLAIIVAVGVLLLLLIIILLGSLARKNVTSFVSTTPTPVSGGVTTVPTVIPALQSNPKQIESGSHYMKTSQEIDAKNKDLYAQQSAVGHVITKLPYTGTNFSANYSYATNNFTVIISAANKTAGNTEFDQWLKSNGVLDQSWIHNLVIDYQ